MNSEPQHRSPSVYKLSWSSRPVQFGAFDPLAVANVRTFVSREDALDCAAEWLASSKFHDLHLEAPDGTTLDEAGLRKLVADRSPER